MRHGFAEACQIIRQQLVILADGPGHDGVLLDCPLVDVDPLMWLSHQKGPRSYWSDRDLELEVAGVGEAFVSSDPQQIWQKVDDIQSAVKALFIFLGMDFGPRKHAKEWQGFGRLRAILPRFLLVREKGETRLLCNIVPEDDAESLKEVLDRVEHLALFDEYRRVSFEVLSSENVFDYGKWQKVLAKSLVDIHNQRLAKVVLSQRVTMDFSRAPDACFLLSRLKERSPHSFSFLMEDPTGRSFFGSSPEPLFLRDGRKIVAQAIAGTRPAAFELKEDEARAQGLLDSAKERREHQLVVESLQEAFVQLCESFSFQPQPQVLELVSKKHLVTGFGGVLKEGVDDQRILETIHPTAAVCGAPRHEAMEHLLQQEPFDRGWFAAPVGVVMPGQARFAVGIRSVLLCGQRAYLYAGAGIVEGSQALEEWEEVSLKLKDRVEVFMEAAR